MNYDWKVVLKDLSERPTQHARFLNTISLMEYMGARKIVKSQKEDHIDSEILAHMTEEIRHAQIFKKMALKLSEGQLKTYSEEHLMAGPEGRSYIQSVDQSVAAALKGEDSHYNYLMSTLLIEERANLVYPYYAQLLEPYGYGSYLRQILREEEHHLEQIRNLLVQSRRLTEAQIEALRRIENDCFQALIGAVARELYSDFEISAPSQI